MPSQREKWLLRLASVGHGYDQDDFLEDAKRVAKALNRALDQEVTILEAFVFWEWRSNDYDAGWLFLAVDDEDLYNDVKKYVDKLMEDDDE